MMPPVTAGQQKVSRQMGKFIKQPKMFVRNLPVMGAS